MDIAVKKIYDSLKRSTGGLGNALSTDVISGTVTSVEPLRIAIENRPVLDSDYLTLSALCMERKITYETNWYPSGKPPNEASEQGDHKHTIEIKFWRGLEIGDVVNMISMSGNQKYYVIERQGMNNDTSD